MTWTDHFRAWNRLKVNHPTLYGTVAVMLYLQRDLSATVLNFAGQPTGEVAKTEQAYLMILFGFLFLSFVLEPALYATLKVARSDGSESE